MGIEWRGAFAILHPRISSYFLGVIGVLGGSIPSPAIFAPDLANLGRVRIVWVHIETVSFRRQDAGGLIGTRIEKP
jgi:hypothetical protein